MALIKKPVRGMKDIMPQEMEIRDYCISVIKKTYAEFGFQSIETPCVENIANLTSKQGGDNEKLIFKILKRGDRLKLEEAKSEDDLVDSGLRYDLTVPLVRYYSNHANDLPSPFKALQMGNVWRADRPQKGRYRQFEQCDIDIIGEPTNMAEKELILATTTTLGRLGFAGFKIHINERRILKAMAAYSGFPGDSFGDVFITLDKMDKIGLDGVREELLENYSAESVEKYVSLFTELEEKESAADKLSYLKDVLADVIEPDVIPGLMDIIDSVDTCKTADFEMVFDPTIVRGMSYYTGTIFEIRMPQLGISAGGGGRYDKMVGKFIGHDVPACGFSIGFERIILILMEQGFKIPGSPKKTAYLVDKKLSSDQFNTVMKKAMEQREKGEQILVARMAKNKKNQKAQLSAQGYDDFEEFYADKV